MLITGTKLTRLLVCFVLIVLFADLLYDFFVKSKVNINNQLMYIFSLFPFLFILGEKKEQPDDEK